MAYADRTRRPPKTLTDRELAKLLKVTGEHAHGFRDNVIISLALGCGLRESEIAALNFGDVTPDGKKIKRVIQLRVFKRAGAGADPEDHRCHVPDATFYKLEKYMKVRYPELFKSPAFAELGFEAPLFPTTRGNSMGGRKGNRISTRRIREMFREWQIAAGFDQLYNFHALRHTAITHVRQATGDIRIAQRFARHVQISSTIRYEHASDEELARAVKGLTA